MALFPLAGHMGISTGPRIHCPADDLRSRPKADSEGSDDGTRRSARQGEGSRRVALRSVILPSERRCGVVLRINDAREALGGILLGYRNGGVLY